jgi:hypothetical protein
VTNTNNPHGLIPVRHMDGRKYNGECRPYYVPSTYATTLYVNDAVVIVSGSNASAVRDHAAGTLSTVAKAADGSGNRITGVIVGFEPVADNVPLLKGAASTTRIAMVADDPTLVCSIQDDGYSVLTAAVVGKNAMLNSATSGNGTTGISGVMLDAGTVTTPSVSANGQLTILGLDPDPANAIGQYAKWLVRINLHNYNPGYDGV